MLYVAYLAFKKGASVLVHFPLLIRHRALCHFRDYMQYFLGQKEVTQTAVMVCRKA